MTRSLRLPQAVPLVIGLELDAACLSACLSDWFSECLTGRTCGDWNGPALGADCVLSVFPDPVFVRTAGGTAGDRAVSGDGGSDQRHRRQHDGQQLLRAHPVDAQ